MKVIAHAAAGTLALATVATFWIATVVTELLLGQSAVVAVKYGILLGMAVLIPALMVTGASGFALAKGRGGRLVRRKQRRMPFVAGNGLLVLVPAAVFLYQKAVTGELDTVFYTVQAVELLAGGVNITLLSLNLRDGLRLSGRRRVRVPVSRAA